MYSQFENLCAKQPWRDISLTLLMSEPERGRAFRSTGWVKNPGLSMFWTVKQMNILNQLLTFFAKICKLKKIQNYQAFCKFLFSKELKFNFNLLVKIFIFILNPMSVELFFSIIGVRRGGGCFSVLQYIIYIDSRVLSRKT